MYVTIAQTVFALVMFGALISALVVFLRHWRYCRVAFKAGRRIYVLLVAISLLATLYSLIFLPEALTSGLGILLQAIEAMVLFAPGLFYCYRRGKEAIKWGRVRQRIAPFPWRAVLTISLISIFVLVYSLVIFNLVPPIYNEEHQVNLEESGLLSPSGFPILVLILISAGIVEEIIFRLYLQTRLSFELHRWGLNPKLGIIIVAFIWALGHAGILVPNGIKEWQIFGVGLALGWTMEHLGLEACIFIHVFLNLIGWILPVILLPLV